MIEYNNNFFEALDSKSSVSAGIIIPLLATLPIKSVLDVGCGRGCWLNAWNKQGVTDIMGVDGTYVDQKKLYIKKEEFKAFDLSKPVLLERKFDFVQSLEVAEHIPEESADIFVDILINHGDIIMFSAAVPGQGGFGHVNEQQYKYWHDKFKEKGFVAVDYIRPLIKNRREIASWYRYNTILFIKKERLPSLPQKFVATIADEIKEKRPLLIKILNSFCTYLPLGIVNTLASFKYFVVTKIKKGAQKPPSLL